MNKLQEEREFIEENFTGILKTAALANLNQYESALNQIDKSYKENLKAIKHGLVKRDIQVYGEATPISKEGTDNV